MEERGGESERVLVVEGEGRERRTGTQGTCAYSGLVVRALATQEGRHTYTELAGLCSASTRHFCWICLSTVASPDCRASMRRCTSSLADGSRDARLSGLRRMSTDVTAGRETTGRGGGRRGGGSQCRRGGAGVVVLRVVLGRSGWSGVGWQLLLVDYDVSRELSLARVDAAVCGGCQHAPAPPMGSSMTMLSSATPALTMGASPASERGGRESDRGQGQSG